MDIDTEIPFKVCLNLVRRKDRRSAVSEQFRMHKLKVSREEALDGECTKKPRGFPSASSRAHYSSILRVLRKANRSNQKAILVFEDDICFHPEFRERLKVLEVPPDWGLLYFGAIHLQQPVRVNSGLVRVTQALDTHAFAINSRYYHLVIKTLLSRDRKNSGPTDALLAPLHKKIPTYAAYPNLVWQSCQYSDIAGVIYSNYGPDGNQSIHMEALAAIQ